MIIFCSSLSVWLCINIIHRVGGASPNNKQIEEEKIRKEIELSKRLEMEMIMKKNRRQKRQKQCMHPNIS